MLLIALETVFSSCFVSWGVLMVACKAGLRATCTKQLVSTGCSIVFNNPINSYS